MHSNKPSLGEAIARLFFAFNFIFSPVSPQMVDYLASMPPVFEQHEADQQLTPLTELPMQSRVTYDPPYPEPDFDVLRTSPESDEVEKELPPGKLKGDVSFTLTSSESVVTTNAQITLIATITNNSLTDINGLVLEDALEKP